MKKRVLAIGLDGYEPSVAARLMDEGGLPNLRNLARNSAVFALDHGAAKRTGLAWEHVSLGKAPQDYGRHAAVRFDPATYGASQFGTVQPPFLGDIAARCVIFDAPYFDLQAAPNCQGLVSWGAHDAGVKQHAVPAGLAQEIEARFGPYPATPYIYGFVWPYKKRAKAMAEGLVRAVTLRGEIGRWLLAERLPDWDLALLVVSEFHSAIEALWHGYDPAHPLHHLPSAAPARLGVVGVYQAFDRMLGDYMHAFPDAELVLFSMHGMGANDSDVPTMLLLPELLYRLSFGTRLFEPRADWATTDVPMLGPKERWSVAVRACMGPTGTGAEPARLDWMPASLYRGFWPRMEAFALPSYYDGRIRINLVGRERDGLVAAADYSRKLDELCDLLSELRNPRTGAPVVRSAERPVADDPLRADPTQADLVILWRDGPLAFYHDRLGLIGPAPYRRTGGHSGGHGIAYFTTPRLPCGNCGTASSFDVMPTLVELLGLRAPAELSGRSLLDRASRAAAVQSGLG
ncbi:MAG: alkaline phosphatase family protein [Rhodospirillaceae bacterium]|nr:alkaline phosphatase family protein [Rhodospirillaceae bacterium]